MNSIIYKTTCSINNKIYIGQTIRKKYNNYYGSGAKIKLAIKKYGVSAFTKEIIDTANSIEELNEKEIYWIDKFNATNSKVGYNITEGGKNAYVAEETKEKLRNSLKGRIINDQWRENISIATKKAMNNPEVKEKLSKNNCMHRKEIREKVSKSKKGQIPWNKGKSAPQQYKKVICLNNKKIFDSVYHTALWLKDELNLNIKIKSIRGAISLCLTNRKDNYKNYIFDYYLGT